MSKKTPQQLGRIYEKEVAERIGGKAVPFSGAGVEKEDVSDSDWLIQTKKTAHKSYSLKLEDWHELAINAAKAGKVPRFEVSIMDKNFVILETRIFDRLDFKDE